MKNTTQLNTKWTCPNAKSGKFYWPKLVMILHLLVAIILVQIVWIQIRPEKASNWTGFILFEWEILTLCWYFWNERRKRFWNIVSNVYLKRNRWYALLVLVEGHRKNKHCRPRSDATERGLWSGSPWFLIKCSIKIWIKNINTIMQPLVQKWTGITDKRGKIHTAKIGNYLYFYFL